MRINSMLINNQRFSIRFCHCAAAIGCKTIGQIKNILDKCMPHCHIHTTRATILKKELDIVLKELSK